MSSADLPPAALADAPHHPIRGAMLFVAGLLLFACMDATTKHLSGRVEVPVIVAVRYIVNFLLLVLLFAPIQARALVETQRTGLVLVRAGCLALSSLVVGFSLQRMPVAETTAITFLAPILVVLLAGPFVGERRPGAGWAALLGFAGVLLIVRPGSGLDPIGVALALAAAVSNVAYQLLSRILVRTERMIALLFYSALAGAIGFSLLLPFVRDGRTPVGGDALLLLVLGAAAALAHFLFTAAYRHAPAAMLAPLTYLQLVWAGLLGWLVFGHVPDGLALAGMAVLVASGLFIALRAPAAPSLPAASSGPDPAIGEVSVPHPREGPSAASEPSRS